MHPRQQLRRDPHKPAVITAGGGEVVTFAELDRRANRTAHLFRNLGLQPGDRVAIWMDNIPRLFDVCWGAHNTGLLYVPVSARLTVAEAAYIVRDSEARLVVASANLDAEALSAELGANIPVLVSGGSSTLEAALAGLPDTPTDGEVQGAPMVYSSGTTGQPKGIAPVLQLAPIDEPPVVAATLTRLYGFNETTVYLSTGPLYHAAPLKFSMAVQAAGGTTVVMERFDAAAALDALEHHGVTHSQWVPTMFVRMLALGDTARARSFPRHRVAVHSAAPCPPEVKRRMLEWWGPIVHEYYSGSEGVGMCAIGPEEWMRKPGSVGRASRGSIHVLDDAGRPLPPGEPGLIWFEGGSRFSYHGDAEKTARATTPEGLGTLGDIGFVDEEGYLFLTDRRDYVIVSGGVNIYPQEAENLLAVHPAVRDVAVFGVPDPVYGEAVKAVVSLQHPEAAGPEMEAELIAYCRGALSSIKCPRSVDFEAEMPREPTGKLIKRLLKARYW